VVTAVDPPRGRATLDVVPEQDAARARVRPAKKSTPRRPPKTASKKAPKKAPRRRN
jgi:hypothetical protein